MTHSVGSEDTYPSQGGAIDVTVSWFTSGDGTVLSLGLEEKIPSGFTFDSVVSGPVPYLRPSIGTSGTLGFAWLAVPSFPTTFTYRLTVTKGLYGQKVLSGRTFYNDSDGNDLATPIVETSLSQELPPRVTLSMTRSMVGNATYPPLGGSIDVSVSWTASGDGNALSLGLEENIPPGFTFNSVVSGPAPFLIPSTGASGKLEFAWIQVPTFPATFTYRLAVAKGLGGDKIFSGQSFYNDESGNDLMTSVLETRITPHQTGTVIVDVTPDTASWSFVDGDSGITSGTGDQQITGVPTGKILFFWAPREGFDSPVSPTSRTLLNDESIQFIGVYARHLGTVVIEATPDTAHWSLVDGDSNITAGVGDQEITGVPTGQTHLTWNSIPYYDSPPSPISRTLAKGTTISFNGVYTRQTGTVKINVSPAEALWLSTDGDGSVTSGTGSTVLSDIPTGIVSLQWMPLSGWITPQPSTMVGNLMDEETINFNGMYRRKTVTITLITEGEGAVESTPPQPVHELGSSVTLVAIPAEHHRFTHWDGNVPLGGRTMNPLTIAMDTTRTLTAHFALVSYALMVNALPGGEVKKSPDATTYTENTQVSLGVTAIEGYHFAHWSGNVPLGAETDNPLLLTMDTTRTLTAAFTRELGTVQIVTSPQSAPWTLSGPDGLMLNDSGTTTLLATPTGDYTLTWQPLDGCTEPLPTSVTLTLARDGEIKFSGKYLYKTRVVEIEVTPETASWMLTDSDGRVTTGTGNSAITEVPAGLITLTWMPLTDYDTPAENPSTRTLTDQSQVLFQAAYTIHKPDLPTNPVPANASSSVSLNPLLSWSGNARAETYAITLWKSSEAKPSSPSATGLLSQQYDPPADLEYETEYSWQVIAENDGGATEGPVWTFTTTVDTSDKQPPAILAGPAVMGITDTAATIEWITDEPATTGMNYGDTPPPATEASVPGFSTTHSITLTDLTPNTTYFIEVFASDEAGNGPTRSPMISFTTSDPPDTTPPVFTDGPNSVVELDQATVTWTTDEPATSRIEYGTDPDNLDQLAVVDGLHLNHSVTLMGLEFSRTYTCRIISTDASSNTAETTIQIFIPMPLVTLSVVIDGDGTVIKNPDRTTTYTLGTSVTLTATPSPGSHFEQWSSDSLSTDTETNPLDIMLDGHTTITAHFALDPISTWTLTVIAEGNGAIEKDPDTASYLNGTTVTVTATADPGYHFSNWSGDMPAGQKTENPLVVTMNATRTLTAIFLPDSYSLTIVAVNGSVLTDPSQTLYDHNTTVALTTTPNTGYLFIGWSGADIASGNNHNNPIEIVMDANKTVTALFDLIPPDEYSLMVLAENGSVSRSLDQPTYISGTLVSLEATPAAHYLFSGWSGDVPAGQEMNNPLAVVMDAEKNITANFQPETHVLTVTAVNGTVLTDPSEALYHHNATVTLTATANQGYVFSGWSGDVPSDLRGNNPVLLTMDNEKSIEAIFTVSHDFLITYKGGQINGDIDTGIAFTGTNAKSTVKIKVLKGDLPADITLINGLALESTTGKAYIRAAVVPHLSTSGDIASIYSDADIQTLQIGGSIGSITTKGSHIEEIMAAGGIGTIKMSSTVNSTPSIDAKVARTSISISDRYTKPTKISLTGVVLTNLSMPNQNLKSLVLASKKIRDRITKETFVSNSGMENGQILTQALGKISAKGAPLAPTLIGTNVSAKFVKISAKCLLFSVGPKGNLNAKAYLANISGYYDVLATKMSVMTNGSDISTNWIITSGELTNLTASIKKYRIGGLVKYHGGQLGTQTDSSTPYAYSLFVSGANASLLPGKKDIKKASGAAGVKGHFMAGANVDWELDNPFNPLFTGSVRKISTLKPGKLPLTPQIIGEAWSNAPIRFYGYLKHEGFTEH